MARFHRKWGCARIGRAHYHLARVDIEQDQLTGAKDHLNAAWRGYQELGMSAAWRMLYQQGRIAYQAAITRKQIPCWSIVSSYSNWSAMSAANCAFLLLLSMSALEQKELSNAILLKQSRFTNWTTSVNRRPVVMCFWHRCSAAQL